MFSSLHITHSRTQTPKLCSGPASWPPGQLPWQPSEFTLCKHLVPETDCVTRSWTFSYSKPPQTAVPLSGCNDNIVHIKKVNTRKVAWIYRRRGSTYFANLANLTNLTRGTLKWHLFKAGYPPIDTGYLAGRFELLFRVTIFGTNFCRMNPSNLANCVESIKLKTCGVPLNVIYYSRGTHK